MHIHPLRHPVRAAALAISLVIVAVLIYTKAVGRAANEPTEANVAAMRTAVEKLEHADVAGSMESVTKLLASKPDPMLEHAATILRSQISGEYEQRQAYWLRRKVINTVVLVPDEASLIRAMGAWTEETYFPVLIDDGWFSAMFIDAFGPRRVVHYAATEAVDASGMEKLVRGLARRHGEVMARYYTPKPAPAAMPAAPPGGVVIDAGGTQRGAGLALALGRGEPIVWYSYTGDARATLSHPDAQQLAAEVTDSLGRTGLFSNQSWSGITLAVSLPLVYNAPPASDAESHKAMRPMGLMAFDDLLGRANGIRLGVTGRLTRDAMQANYQAMCSLFLQPKRALLVDDYGRRPGEAFEHYRLELAQELLRGRMKSELLTGEGLTLATYRAAIAPRHDLDLLLINSSGFPARWAISGNENASPDDIPIGRPLAVHMIHSYSAAEPQNPDTIAGRAIAGGAFWYYGSVHEPYLVAFEYPTSIIARALTGTPLAFAAKQLPGHPMYQPWKLTVIGDPLYAFRASPAARLDQLPVIDGAREVTPIEPTLADAPTLSPGQLARAAFNAVADHHAEQLEALPNSLASSHPVTTALVRQQLIVHLRAQLAAGAAAPAADAQRTLTRILQLGCGDSEPLKNALHLWLSAQPNAEQAAAFLRSLSEQTLPDNSKRAIIAALPPNP